MSEQRLDRSKWKIIGDNAIVKGNYWNPLFSEAFRAQASEDAEKARANTAEAERDALRERVRVLEEALIWCSGSADFQVGGKAKIGWDRICRPLLALGGGKEEG